MRHRQAWILVSCLWLSMCSVCWAEAPDEPPPGYTEAISQALVELEADNYPEAREEFRRAHALYPSARTLRGLGMIEFELRNYKESVRLLEEALSSSVKPLAGNLRSETESLLTRARRYLGELHVEVQPRVPSVLIDGTRVDLPADGVLRLEVGEHTLEALADGHSPERRVLRIEGGKRLDLYLALGLLPAEDEAIPEAPRSVELATQPASPRADKPLYKRWWLWTTVAVVAVGGATVAAVMLTRDKGSPAEPAQGTNTVPGVSLQTLRTH